jgi:hypothetical protein
MNRPRRLRRAALAATAATALALSGLALSIAPPAYAATNTTAWHNGTFNVDTPNLVRRSDIWLGAPNNNASQFVPLGNGTLGAAVWSAGGFTAQLNRTDTLPDRKSPGQVTIPGLSVMTGASNFSGYLDLYDGTLHESGGGMTMTAYLRADTAELVVDVTGASPTSTQTAQAALWTGRSPSAQASGAVATLAETWVDNSGSGNSGQTFGSLAAVTAGGRNVTASNPNSTTARVSFQPNADGSFRVIFGAPQWTGGNALTTATSLFGSDATAASTPSSGHLSWWHNFWANTGLIHITSSDGTGDYIENLRTLYLYDSAAESRDTFPGSQAGVADLFNFSQDHQDWFPAGYWFWNLRMQMQANMSAGAFGLDDPLFRLYANNVTNIKTWTSANMGGRAGLCVPETMRFNGNGTYNGGTSGGSCDQNIGPNYNAMTITTGAEVGLWVWQRYLMTDDRTFLSTNYPLMSGAAQFLLAEATTGSDGLLHTTANAHETQWNVTDPTTDILAMQALFPATVQAAQTLGLDASLVTQLNTAIPKIPPLPRTDTATKSQNLTASSDASSNDMIGMSTQPTAATHNDENIGLEAVWPYNVIGDTSSMLALAKRTFTSRSYVNGNDWSNDSLQAARLGLGSDVKNDILASIRSYQAYPSGLASFTGSAAQEPYIEQIGVLTAAVDEGFVQDYDGLLRIAPAWPSDWSGDGTVYIQHNSKVYLQVSGGTPVTVAIAAGSGNTINMRSPWPGQSVTVVDGASGATVVGAQSNATFSIPAQSGHTYLVELTSSPFTSLTYAAVTGSPAAAARHYSSNTIGIDGTGGSTTGPTFYPDINYGGTGVRLGVGSYDLAQLQSAGIANDSVSSIRVPSGYTVTAYGDSGFAGTSWVFNADNANLGSSGNDAISSVKVTTTTGGTSTAISLRAHANSMYVCADTTGTSPLIANRTAIGQWETFDMLDQGNGNIALRSHANNLYVTAGTNPLIASKSTIGTSETFQLIHNSDGSVSLKALANNDYVTAENAGAAALIANRTAIGPWEEFDLIND